MAGFRYPFDVQTTLEPWRDKLGTDYDAVSAHLADRDRSLEDYLASVDPVGRLEIFAGVTIPRGWLLCDGSAVSRTTYSALFAAVGTTYGTGDGSTTFNVPNLKGRVVAGQDAGQTEFTTLGQTGGEKTHTLTAAETPDHGHGVTDPQHDHTSVNGAVFAVSIGGSQNSQMGQTTPVNDGLHGEQITYASADGAATGLTVNNTTGGGGAHNNLQPYIALPYIIRF